MSDARMCIDTLGRIWYSYFVGDPFVLAFYEDGQWNQYGYVDCAHIVSDGNGGVWLAYINNLTHIDSNLNSQQHHVEGDIYSMYNDNSNTLWVISEDFPNRQISSFDGSDWIDYYSSPGAPSMPLSITQNNAGDIIVLAQKISPEEEGEEGEEGEDEDEGSDNASIYLFSNNEFLPLVESLYVHTAEETGSRDIADILSHNGILYCLGDLGDVTEQYERNVLKISANSTSTAREIWTGTFPANIESASAIALDLEPGIDIPAGTYLLKTQLVSSANQVLAEDGYTFVIRGTAVSVSLKADPLYGKYVKKETPLDITLESFNNTTDTKNNLNLQVTKTSPSGESTSLINQAVTLTPGQAGSETITFNESEPGNWIIESTISEGDNTLSAARLMLEVTEPQVTTEIIAPAYAGDSPFDVKIKLLNHGQIDAAVDCSISGAASGSEIDESFQLKPGEERIVKTTDTIEADTLYTVTVGGDAQYSGDKTVTYAYVENFVVTLQPLYREGYLSLPYTLSNSGHMPFESQVEINLYAVGVTEPLVTLNRSYNLYPGEEAGGDALRFDLEPGSYIFKYKSQHTAEQELPFAVMQAGAGTVTLTAGKYPLGPNEIAFKIVNTDTVAGSIDAAVILKNGDTEIVNEIRSYYLEPGEETNDTLTHDFTAKGNYIVTISGPKLTTPQTVSLRLLNLFEIQSNLTVGAAAGNIVPVTVSLANNGYSDFNGSVAVEIDGKLYQEPISAASETNVNTTVSFDTGLLAPGSKEVKVYLHDSSGEILQQYTGSVVLTGPDIRVIETPQDLQIDAGGYAAVTIKLKNMGNLAGEVMFKTTVFDTFSNQQAIQLEAGQEIEISEMIIDAPADLPYGTYPFNYTISGTGVPNGLKTGNFNFTVKGVDLAVEAALDKTLYNVGETAQLILDIVSTATEIIPMETVVNWGDFSQRQNLTLNPGTNSLVFEIPLPEKRDEKLFYGIYHEGGKGIHLNDIYIYFSDTVSVVSDKQVYEPGETIQATFSSAQNGTLEVDAFDENVTLPLSSSVSQQFAVPENTPGGTYGISWHFTPSDTTIPPVSGTHSFDVAGLVVKVAKSGLDKGKYAPGDVITSSFMLESNQTDTLQMRCWSVAPSGEWEIIGESNISLSAGKQTAIQASYPFNTSEAGPHQLAYALYKEDETIAAGSMSFETGDAVLLSITSDHFDYPLGDENISVIVNAFGEGAAQLVLYLEEEQVAELPFNVDGLSSVEVPISSSLISGGRHTLKALLTKGGLTSTCTTGFIYGSTLPDLTLALLEQTSENLDYSYQIEITNKGKTPSVPTTLAFFDNQSEVETLPVPQLQPGAVHQVTINWNGSGKAGDHEFLFEIDSTATVKEYSETNNSIIYTLDVPALFFKLEVESLQWPANTEIPIITRLINNQETLLPFNLQLVITSDGTGETIFQAAHADELPASGSKAISDNYNTGINPAGDYTIVQHLSSPNINDDLYREIPVRIEETKALNATLEIPRSIPSGTGIPLELTVNLENAGNVPLDNEPLIIEIYNPENDGVVKTDESLVTIPCPGSTIVERTIMLDIEEGQYEVRVKYLQNVIVSANLTAEGALELTRELAHYPRVLVMNPATKHGPKGKKHGKHKGNRHNKKNRHGAPNDTAQSTLNVITGLLQAEAIQYETAEHIAEAYVKIHKNHSNLNILAGRPRGRLLRDELVERVWQGEGLILFCSQPGHHPDWHDFLGMEIRQAHRNEKEFTIRLLETPLSNEGEMQLISENRLIIKNTRQDVRVIAETLQAKQPVIAYRKYGKGHILVCTIPAVLAGGSENMAQLLSNAVKQFNVDIHTISDLTRVVPVEFSLSNRGTEDKTVTVKEILPYGVEVYDTNPLPMETDETGELKWNLTVPAAGVITVSYWVRLPDQIGSYALNTGIYNGDTLLDEAVLTLDVSQIVISRIDEILVQLEQMEVSGKDYKYIRRAARRLEKIRNRSGDGFMHHLTGLFESVRAAHYLYRVKSVDVSTQRLQAGIIMRIMGRRFYEKSKQWGAMHLQSCVGMITDE
ncbi:MAG: hypothetical protein GY757_01460 [bacterium]|nr:hypothetical protein [bacterium]